MPKGVRYRYYQPACQQLTPRCGRVITQITSDLVPLHPHLPASAVTKQPRDAAPALPAGAERRLRCAAHPQLGGLPGAPPTHAQRPDCFAIRLIRPAVVPKSTWLGLCAPHLVPQPRPQGVRAATPQPRPRLAVVVHGTASCSDFLLPLSQAIANKAGEVTGDSWAVVAVDLRNHGGSSVLPFKGAFDNLSRYKHCAAALLCAKWSCGRARLLLAFPAPAGCVLLGVHTLQHSSPPPAGPHTVEAAAADIVELLAWGQETGRCVVVLDPWFHLPCFIAVLCDLTCQPGNGRPHTDRLRAKPPMRTRLTPLL